MSKAQLMEDSFGVFSAWNISLSAGTKFADLDTEANTRPFRQTVIKLLLLNSLTSPLSSERSLMDQCLHYSIFHFAEPVVETVRP